MILLVSTIVFTIKKKVKKKHVFFFLVVSVVKVKEEDITIISDGHGNTIRCLEWHGHYLPVRGIEKGLIPDPRKSLPPLRHLQLRPDDVFLLAYPKAGMHNIYVNITLINEKNNVKIVRYCVFYDLYNK